MINKLDQELLSLVQCIQFVRYITPNAIKMLQNQDYFHICKVI